MTRPTIWLALICYAISVITLLHNSRATINQTATDRWARRWWTIGCLLYLLHVMFAFHEHYQGSHSVALTTTLAQTESQTGVRTSAGIYVNYLFTLIWVIDCAYWWTAGIEKYRQRGKWISRSVHGFFLFMIVNGAIVFVTGYARWLGVLIVAVVCFQWARNRRIPSA